MDPGQYRHVPRQEGPQLQGQLLGNRAFLVGGLNQRRSRKGHRPQVPFSAAQKGHKITTPLINLEIDLPRQGTCCLKYLFHKTSLDPVWGSLYPQGMNRSNLSINSLQSYATLLRRTLLKGCEIEGLLKLHESQQEMVERLTPLVKGKKLHPADGFAWGFIKEVKILRPDFKPEAARLRPRGAGVFQDFTARVIRVQEKYFPELEERPKVRWLAKFTVRKLAHYNLTRDEVAFSLIFDRLDAPKEILDYLAFHELLHKVVGLKREKGRMMAHTPEFKALERNYPDFAQMDPKITAYIQSQQTPEPR